MPGAPQKRPYRLLVVDDDEAVLWALHEVLEQRGFEIIEALDSGTAIAVAEAEPGAIDLLITDVMMPVVSGFALAERLRKTRPDLPVLYISGYSPGFFARRGQQAEDLLQKPFTPGQLCERVDRALAEGHER